MSYSVSHKVYMLSRWTNNPNCLLSKISDTAMLWHEQMALTYRSPRMGGTRDNRDSYRCPQDGSAVLGLRHPFHSSSHMTTLHIWKYIYIYNGSTQRYFSRPLGLIHIYTAYYILSPSGIVLHSNTEIPLVLGMSRGLVHVAARCFRLGTPGCGRNLFHSKFLPDIRVQRILQSSSAK
jgi:hypothetical protein